MAQDFGNGVSRTLSASNRQFQVVVWQASKPPLDSELNLMAQVAWERAANEVRANMHSGFLLDPMRASMDYMTNPDWSNWFYFGDQGPADLSPVIWANVNGWVIPVTGTRSADGTTSNRIDLWGPPTSDTRIDFVYLEAWLSQVAPNPSTENKPSATFIWKYGNTMFGGTNEPDDMEDPTIGFETTERLQVQYRIRVFGEGDGAGQSVDLSTFPDALDDPNVVAQGNGLLPLASYPWTNMRDELGDPSLWRAGNGDASNDLKTVDGYSYAIPICAIFRRNSDYFVAAMNGSTAANQNGALNRNPTSATLTDPAEGSRTFTDVRLTSDLATGTTGNVDVLGLTGSGMDNSDISWDSYFIVINNEIIHLTGVSAASGTITIRTGDVGTTDQGRGRWGTQDTYHSAGSVLRFFNSRPDDLFSDEIHRTDLLDMRRGVTPGEWDYDQLLAHNLTKLFQGELHSTWKQAAVSDTEGPVVVEVDTLWNDGASAVPAQTEALDGPDGIRTAFSDAAILQSDVTLLLSDQGAGSISSWTSGHTWDVAADFAASGYQIDAGGITNGDSVFLYIGGNDGTGGARSSMRAGTERAVRFVNPREQALIQRGIGKEDAATGRQNPVSVKFLGEQAMDSPSPAEALGRHPGPYHPLQAANFEAPFVFLGGLLHTLLNVTDANLYENSSPGSFDEIEFTGLDFDVNGAWFAKDAAGLFQHDPSLLTNPLYHDQKTLFGLLTRAGSECSGLSSDMYIVISGAGTALNNGVYKVLGAGQTAGYTAISASAPDRMVLTPMMVGHAGVVAEAGLPAEARSWMTSAEDGTGAVSGQAAACLVFTDVEGLALGDSNPWGATNLGPYAITSPLTGDFAINLTLAYSPGRGGLARVADEINTFSVIQPASGMLRQAPSSIDSLFYSEAGVVAVSESYYPPEPLQVWNRLDSKGLGASKAPAFGGGRIHLSEESREAEVFVDPGSKTVLFRPFQSKGMTLQPVVLSNILYPASYAVGDAHGQPIDGAGLFQSGALISYALPPEYMPRFGRQDIPFYQDTTGAGTGAFLDGINHLFQDNTTNTSQVFNIIGGTDNVGVAGVNPIFAQTGDFATTALYYGEYGVIAYGAGNCYQARKIEDVNVISSDVPRGLRGIELPPFLGVARIYGIYDGRDWDGAGAWTNRVVPVTDHIPNLLRKDADLQTLYIKEGGGEDVTGDADAHTYIIPEDLIDIKRSASYVAGETWDDIDFVVEFTCFGFGLGFINKNNYVAMRAHNAEGNDPLGIGLGVLTDVSMVLPAAAPSDTECYAAYRRTVYQGDPYMTKGQSTRAPGLTDYATRYGQVSVANAWELSMAIQQYCNDTDYSQIPTKPNPRALEVLAASDFYTTLGTGKMGGSVYAGTLTDVGCLDCSGRIPASSTAMQYQVRTRVFTEGQPDFAPRGVVTLEISNTTLADETFSIIDRGGLASIKTWTWDGGGATDPAVGADSITSATNAATILQADSEIPSLYRMSVQYFGDNKLHFVALDAGSFGNTLAVRIADTSTTPMPTGQHLHNASFGASVTSVNSGWHPSELVLGGSNLPANGGNGASPINMGGMTERLPLGILVQDSDFVGEDPLNVGASVMTKPAGSNSPTSMMAPLFDGREYHRVVGGAGAEIGMCDGAIGSYMAYSTDAPSGVRQFRLFRGGGSLYDLDRVAGGPVEWYVEGWSSEQRPVLKGGVLVGRAFLVRNYEERAFSSSDVTTHGDEIQMVIATRAIYGQGIGTASSTPSYTLEGEISPTGYGKGYAAADRYRLEGYPMMPAHSKDSPFVNPELAPYPNIDPATDDPCP